MLWQRDAAYEYYKHGLLARTELGAQRVQGIDYAYTLQGWLKGLNTTSTSNVTFDMGPGRMPGGANGVVAWDMVGLCLALLDSTNTGNTWIDYKAISGAAPFARAVPASGFVSLYNGNIGGISIYNAGLTKGPVVSTDTLPLFYQYPVRSVEPYRQYAGI